MGCKLFFDYTIKRSFCFQSYIARDFNAQQLVRSRRGNDIVNERGKTVVLDTPRHHLNPVTSGCRVRASSYLDRNPQGLAEEGAADSRLTREYHAGP
jgi:hypothetical protein